MTNSYFDGGDYTELTPNTLARASQVNDIASAVVAGFDLLPDPTALDQGRVTYAATVGGTANAITLTLPNTLASYTAGLSVSFKAASDNTGATTVNIDAVGAKAIKAPGGAALSGGEIQADAVVTIAYNGTDFILTSGYVSADQTTLAGIAANITTVAGISANVTAVAGVSASVATVAGIAANVTTVAGNSANVTTVAGISADVTAVAAVDGETATVAGIAANVTAVAAVAASVTAVAAVDTEVAVVAGIAADVTTVAAIAGDISEVASAINVEATVQSAMLFSRMTARFGG